MTTEVKCSICGLLIDSTTVEAEEYEVGDIVDYGCPYCGHNIPLKATSDKKKRGRKRVVESESTEEPV